MDIKVRVEAPELAGAVLALAEAVAQKKLDLSEGPEVAVSKEPEPAPAPEPAPEPEPAPAPETATLDMSTVRARLSTISQSGKADAVKALIKTFGVSKLTDIPEERYTELLEKAEKL